MRFKKDGKVYESFEDAVNAFFLGDRKMFYNGEKKGIAFTGNARQSMIRAYEDADMVRVRLEAKLMGYEVIEDDTPTIAEAVEKHSEDVKPDPTWQERMQKEYRELKERYEKLHKMVTKYEAGTLGFTPNCSLELLCQQKRHMGEYLHDLEIRAEIEGVEL